MRTSRRIPDGCRGTHFVTPGQVRQWGGGAPPPWIREIAQDRARPLVNAEPVSAVPGPGDVVLKPCIDHANYKQLFRVETWNTHDLLEGPFENVRVAMDAAFEFGATARLAVWLDYSDDPSTHELDAVPLYIADNRTITANRTD
jgi:hypothetical protein